MSRDFRRRLRRTRNSMRRRVADWAIGVVLLGAWLAVMAWLPAVVGNQGSYATATACLEAECRPTADTRSAP